MRIFQDSIVETRFSLELVVDAFSERAPHPSCSAVTPSATEASNATQSEFKWIHEKASPPAFNTLLRVQTDGAITVGRVEELHSVCADPDYYGFFL
ncbi:unnamed protein product [Ectocarpus sp. CCAP 1310/34]|nr:unnamed protein product [Ectocarpus sp. CCAP 1310/34]